MPDPIKLDPRQGLNVRTTGGNTCDATARSTHEPSNEPALVDTAVSRSIRMLASVVRDQIERYPSINAADCDAAMDEWFDLLLRSEDTVPDQVDSTFRFRKQLDDLLPIVAVGFTISLPAGSTWPDLLEAVLHENWDELLEIAVEANWTTHRLVEAYWDGQATQWALELGLPPDSPDHDVLTALTARTQKVQEETAAFRRKAAADLEQRVNELAALEEDNRQKLAVYEKMLRNTFNLPDNAPIDGLTERLDRVCTYLKERVGDLLNRPGEGVTIDEVMEFAEEHPELVRGWLQPWTTDTESDDTRSFD